MRQSAGAEDEGVEEGNKGNECESVLLFPPKIQLCYGQSINLCELAHMDMIGEQ